MADQLQLYSYWRSSAAYRVRIGLNLKGLAYETLPVHLVRVACDIHPLNNLRVLQYFDREWNVPQPERDEWVRHWVSGGFAAVEAVLNDHPSTGDFCEGNTPGLADCCLVPQVYHAQRFGVDLAPYPAISSVAEAAQAHPAFVAAHPNQQPDAVHA